jgi:chromate reductase
VAHANESVPGGLKNAIDWASRRTYGDKANSWGGKPLAIAGVGPQPFEGAHGGLLAGLALRQCTMFLEWKVIESPKIHINRAADRFTVEGTLKPEVCPIVGGVLMGVGKVRV